LPFTGCLATLQRLARLKLNSTPVRLWAGQMRKNQCGIIQYFLMEGKDSVMRRSSVIFSFSLSGLLEITACINAFLFLILHCQLFLSITILRKKIRCLIYLLHLAIF
jgi:hypothetical protein